jgi:hypothetical protein
VEYTSAVPVAFSLLTNAFRTVTFPPGPERLFWYGFKVGKFADPVDPVT